MAIDTVPGDAPVKERAAMVAASPPITKAPSPPMTMSPRRAGRAVQSAVNMRGAERCRLF